MRTGFTVIMAIALILGLSGAAHAAQLFTPAIEAGIGSNGVTCRAVNVGKKTIDITLEIVNSFGVTTASTGSISLPAGGVMLLDYTPTSGGRYCVITFTGGKKKVRGSLYVRDSNGSAIGTVQAE